MIEPDLRAQLLDKMTSWGMIIDSPVPMLDGNIHRCKTQNSKSSNDKRGWYRGGIEGDKLWCVWNAWDEEISTPQTFLSYQCQYDKRFNSEQALRKFIAATAVSEECERFEIGAKKAAEILAICKPADPSHPYLVKKGVNAYDLLQHPDGSLVMPIYNFSNSLRSVQFIYPDGTKKNMYGGQKKGCCHSIDGDRSRIMLCEGFATGASIAEATGHMVLVCIDVHNMMAVADAAPKNLRGFLVACVDNDKTKDINIGVETGRKMVNANLIAEMAIPQCSGSDFNDMHQELGLKAVRDCIVLEDQEILTAEEIDKETSSITILNLTPKMTDPGGLISLGMKACKNSSIADVDAYNLPIVLTLIARAISGVIRLGDVWPSLFQVKVGGTSTGKTSSDNFFRRAIIQRIPGFYGPTDFASGAGLLRGLIDNPRVLISLDEITYLFKRYDKPNVISDEKKACLMELYSKSGAEVNKPYGDGKKNVIVQFPCINLTGNATPLVLKEIRPDDLASGLIQRFTFWVYNGDAPRRTVSFSDEIEVNHDLNAFVSGLANLVQAGIDHRPDLAAVSGQATNVQITSNSVKILLDFSNENIDRINSLDESRAGEKGIISRMYDECQKYALIHMASRCHGQLFDNPINTEDIVYGIALVRELAEWKINNICKRAIIESEYHADCEELLSACRSVIQGNMPPTLAVLCQRRSKIKAWKPRYREELIQGLVDIGAMKIDNTGKSTRYWPLKNKL